MACFCSISIPDDYRLVYLGSHEAIFSSEENYYDVCRKKIPVLNYVDKDHFEAKENKTPYAVRFAVDNKHKPRFSTAQDYLDYWRYDNPTEENVVLLCAIVDKLDLESKVDKSLTEAVTVLRERLDNGETFVTLNIKSGLNLIEFQFTLELCGGSILMPITWTKDNYVYIKGQTDFIGEEI